MNLANENLDGQHVNLEDAEQKIAVHFASILELLRIDWQADSNTQGTPARYAKMLCREVCRGRFTNAPKLTTFPNPTPDSDMQMTGPISVRSLCSHHFCPIIGQCWIAYIPGNRVVGLSKFDRVVDWFASRPQIQEGLAVQIADFLVEHLQPRGLALVIRAQHTCMSWRGVKAHPEAGMGTNVMRGTFRTNAAARAEFLQFVGR
jgi:GTP cyclohydrolase I